MKNKRQSIGKYMSPFWLLTIPFFMAFALMLVGNSTEILQEKIQISASFIELPKVDFLRVLFRF